MCRGKYIKINKVKTYSPTVLVYFSAEYEFVYYESLKRALKTKTIYGYRCDERLKTNVGKSTRLSCTPYESCRFFNFSFQSFISPTLIYKFCLQLSFYRFIINSTLFWGMSLRITSTQVPKKHMIGWQIKSLTCSGLRIRLKRKSLFETGVILVGTVS